MTELELTNLDKLLNRFQSQLNIMAAKQELTPEQKAQRQAKVQEQRTAAIMRKQQAAEAAKKESAKHREQQMSNQAAVHQARMQAAQQHKQEWEAESNWASQYYASQIAASQ